MKVLGSQQWRRNRLEKLDVFRSSGLDGNHPKLLEELVGLSVRPLSICILKKGKKEDLGNYMPVSFTSVNGKIMERIISSSQPRKANRVFDLIAGYDKMTGSVGKDRVVGVIYLDLNIAFDTSFPSLPLWKQQKQGLDKQTV